MNNKFVVLDTHALIYRSFYAIRDLTTTEGKHTNAVYGFSKILLKILNDIKPKYFACVIDLPGKTFRHKEFKDYKGTRSKAPDELYEQIPYIYEVLSAANIPVIGIESYEADDVAGSISKSCKILPDVPRLLITGDMDYLQLVDDKTTIVRFKKGFSEVIYYDKQKVLEEVGVSVEQIIDYKALVGDSSDNIPGVKGVGPVTARKLINTYKTLDGIYSSLDKIDDKLKLKLESEKDVAYISQHLSKIVTDIDLSINEKDLILDFDNLNSKLVPVFKKYEFNHLLSRFIEPDNKVEEKSAIQQNLF